jgi:curli biogenesis system outer membrane secretion channel CsgG
MLVYKFREDKMKVFVVFLFVVVATFVLVSCATSRVEKMEEKTPLKERTPLPMGKRRTVAILEFVDKSAYGHGRVAKAATEILTTYLHKSQQFILVERQKLDKVIGELKLQRTKEFDPTTAVEIGKLVGANAVVFGVISQFGAKKETWTGLLAVGKKITVECIVDIRVVDVKTGVIIYADRGGGKAIAEASKFMGMGSAISYDETLEADALRAAIVKFVDNIIDTIQAEWSG